jgi:hypothetical protein
MDSDRTQYSGHHPNPAGDRAADPNDVVSVDAVIRAMYSAISFEPGAEPDWQRFRSLFLKGATLVPRRAGSEPEIEVLSVDHFVVRSDQLLRDGAFLRRGFLEEEISRKTEQYEGIVSVFSSYQSFFADTREPFYRGINSLQVVKHKGRWWILSVAWENERSRSPIPPEYLSS